jgi:2-(1,2-epoxy-1,2-dihydrophenyl)acetyl-CoA isomerase
MTMATATTYRYVIARVADGVGTLTLNRPDRLNAFDGAMRLEMVNATRELVADPRVRSIVITGSGRGFCTGADTSYLGAALSERRYEDAMGLVRSGGEMVRLLHEAPKPVLACLNGPAAGGGASLALACDLRLASDRASMGQVFHRIGLLPDMGSTWLLPHLVGTSAALELIWSAEMIPAQRCLELGLVNRVVPHERLEQETGDWAARLAALPPLAAGLAKSAVYRAQGAGLGPALALEEESQLRCFRSRDAVEGFNAFAAKRAPVFTGE